MLGNFLGDNLFFNQKLKYKKKYSNKEILYFQYFYNITGVYPEHLIIVGDFIFFFVSNAEYLRLKLSFLKRIRNQLIFKVLLIRAEEKLINLLFGFFPDPYIHDIQFRVNKNTGKVEATIFFLSFEERGIAVGRNGEYIKAVNKIFEKFIHFKDNTISIKIKCELFSL